MQAPDLAALHGDAAPALAELTSMVRRRMDPLGRAALQVAYWAQGGEPTGPVVFASRWGEIARSVSLLRQLAQQDPLSPLAFSMSVHNASSAAYSIARGDFANYTAVSAGPCSAAAGLCEAVGLLADGAPQVLVVSVESALPEPHEQFDELAVPTRAWAVLIESGEEIGLEASFTQPEPSTNLPPDLVTLQFLAGSAAELRQTGWHWTRRV